MARIPNPALTYTSVNSMLDKEQPVKFPAEFLNSVEVSGLPQHILSLKVGMPVMLLRSIKPPELMNETRCIIYSCNRNTLEVEIAVGAHKGEIHLVPSIPLQPSDTTFQFKLQRRQLPLKGCFAITSNKAQEQTWQSIGPDLSQSSPSRLPWDALSCAVQKRKARQHCLHVLTAVIDNKKYSLQRSVIKYIGTFLLQSNDCYKTRMFYSYSFFFFL